MIGFAVRRDPGSDPSYLQVRRHTSIFLVIVSRISRSISSPNSSLGGARQFAQNEVEKGIMLSWWNFH